MRRFDVLLFDLDGTLTDTRPGIMESLSHTFRTLGLPPYGEPDRFLGPPLPDSFRKLCGMNAEETAKAVRIFREKYSKEELFNAALFDGMQQTLSALRDAGCTLAVATCKVETYARQILDHFGIAEYFTYIGGSDPVRTQKSDVIAYVLAQLGEPDRARVLMIGDRDNDINGARAQGIGCLYALWGYGSAAEAAEHGAMAVAENPLSCVDLVLKSGIASR